MEKDATSPQAKKGPTALPKEKGVTMTMTSMNQPKSEDTMEERARDEPEGEISDETE